ncbi:MAG: hypothetical protein KDD41_00615 [Flavobacteriales bacterium]|nr:hypothetical protein [Flavobacteriales bacterium]
MKFSRSWLLAVLFPFQLLAQEGDLKKAGEFELGMRNTISTFGSTGNTGFGFGGQFRIRLSNRINTEWFADYFTENIDGLANRSDYHIGWSVMFYPMDPVDKKVVPYILAGHCFDYTKIAPVYNPLTAATTQEVSRLSSATQAGLGAHIYLTEQFNLSLSGQYMIHLGNDIHTDIHEENGHREIHIEEPEKGALSLEGHLLFTVSLNFKIGKLW